MGQLTDALKEYKKDHPEIGLADGNDGFKLTPFHAHILHTVSSMQRANGAADMYSAYSRTEPTADASNVVDRVKSDLGVPEDKVIGGMRELGKAGMLNASNFRDRQGGREVFDSPSLGKKVKPPANETEDEFSKRFSDSLNNNYDKLGVSHPGHNAYKAFTLGE